MIMIFLINIFLKNKKKKEDLTKIKYKIQPNLYDEMEIIEDESIPFEPSLSKEYNLTNYFYSLASSDEVTQQKLEYAKAKKEKIMSVSGATNANTQAKLDLWAKHLMDKEMLDKIHPENLTNVTPQEYTGNVDVDPKDNYNHYEEIVNDMLAKLLPEEGYLRLEPVWKWMALELGSKFFGYDPMYVYPTDPYHFPEGLMVMKVEKFLKVRDRYLDPEACKREMEHVSSRSFLLQKYYGNEDKADEEKISYLQNSTKDRFLLINLRFGTFSVARYDETPDPSVEDWNFDIEKARHEFHTKAQLLEETKSGFDHADMQIYRIPPKWIIALKSVKFPVYAGTPFNAPQARLLARMKILKRMQYDDNPLRSDISELASSLPYLPEG